ncbi:hypothetical protein M0813_18430 [Anaeramoeba flamelloides]|uniref:Uncharacterized protein n=1 Tax=Anaeramoeba flamelloides TaxID=1746091 RepID=A0ABQ8YTF7_9EUKA|nr:hypothetical protein M0813_18430 [Anaeramoeba flamelloides]
MSDSGITKENSILKDRTNRNPNKTTKEKDTKQEEMGIERLEEIEDQKDIEALLKKKIDFDKAQTKKQRSILKKEQKRLIRYYEKKQNEITSRILLKRKLLRDEIKNSKEYVTRLLNSIETSKKLCRLNLSIKQKTNLEINRLKEQIRLISNENLGIEVENTKFLNICKHYEKQESLENGMLI